MSSESPGDKVSIFDQNPAGDVVPESPLHHCHPATAGGDANGGVRLGEKPFLGHLSLRGDAGDEDFRRAVAEALGTELPLEPLTVNRTDEVSAQWISPDEWLILVPGGREHPLELAMRQRLQGHYSIVNVSGGQTVITLSGPNARDVLMKSAPYDFHPRHFPVGKAVLTVFAKASANVRRIGEDEWELVIRRSFADYCWRWLNDASAEYGLAERAP